jgi:periplasmic divalent cation tolerance protein
LGNKRANTGFLCKSWIQKGFFSEVIQLQTSARYLSRQKTHGSAHCRAKFCRLLRQTELSFHALGVVGFGAGIAPAAMADCTAQRLWETRMTEPTALCDIAVLTTTVASEAEALQLVQLVLQARLAACVQVEPITAYFRWQGAQQEDREFRLVCKTAPRALHPLLALVRAHHPYVLPQLVVQTLQGSAEYADWVDAQVAHPVVSA